MSKCKFLWENGVNDCHLVVVFVVVVVVIGWLVAVV